MKDTGAPMATIIAIIGIHQHDISPTVFHPTTEIYINDWQKFAYIFFHIKWITMKFYEYQEVCFYFHSYKSNHNAILWMSRLQYCFWYVQNFNVFKSVFLRQFQWQFSWILEFYPSTYLSRMGARSAISMRAFFFKFFKTTDTGASEAVVLNQPSVSMTLQHHHLQCWLNHQSHWHWHIQSHSVDPTISVNDTTPSPSAMLTHHFLFSTI